MKHCKRCECPRPLLSGGICQPCSSALTANIITWRDRGLSWGQISIKTQLTRQACKRRYLEAHQLSERQRRKHAESVIEALRARIAELEQQLEELEHGRA